MSNEKWAVGVAYNFGLVPSEELKDIKLGDYGTVHIDGKTYSLYKAITYEGSREIDKLLDKYGEYPIKDYKLEPVIMSGEFEMILPGFDKETACIGFGSYTFKCEGKEIPFDFSGVSYDLEQDGDKITVSFETGRTMMNTHCFIDDCYSEEYKNLGIRLNDITAKFLSEATEIIDFYIDGEIDNKEFSAVDLPEGGKFTLKSLCFSDGSIYDYPVKEDVINAYNNRVNREYFASLDNKITKAKETRPEVSDNNNKDIDYIK